MSPFTAIFGETNHSGFRSKQRRFLFTHEIRGPSLINGVRCADAMSPPPHHSPPCAGCALNDPRLYRGTRLDPARHGRSSTATSVIEGITIRAPDATGGGGKSSYAASRKATDSAAGGGGGGGGGGIVSEGSTTPAEGVLAKQGGAGAGAGAGAGGGGGGGGGAEAGNGVIDVDLSG